MHAENTAARLILSRYGRPVFATEAEGCHVAFNARELNRDESLFLYRRDGEGWRMSGSRVATGGSYTPFDPTMPEPS